MAFTYPLTLPSTPLPSQSKFRMRNAVAVVESPFTLSTQKFEHQGKRWEAEIVLPPMRRAKAEAWIALVAKLQGAYGTFLMGDWDGRVPRGIATGTPLVNGAGQTGDTLITDGWTNNRTGILLAGDYLQLGTGATAQLYKVLEDANSGASTGPATFRIWPNLRTSPANNAAIVVQNTVGVFRLATDFEWDANEVSSYGMRFLAVENL